VAHSTLLRLVLCQLLGIPMREYRRLFPHVRNCGITQLVLDGDRVELLAFNAPVDGRW
jgi:broad specificity phosphatase PhoE